VASGRAGGLKGVRVLVLGIDTATPQTSVALGTERGIVAAALLSTSQPNHEVVIPTVQHLLRWADLKLSAVGGIAVGLGPGLFTGMRAGLATAKTLAQTLIVPIAGLASLDVVAFSARYTSKLICATIDAKRGEAFYAFYRPVPGGVTRQTAFEVGPPERLVAELQARGEEVLLVGSGALVYRRALEDAVTRVEFASAVHAHPLATALVELAIPRFQREDYDRLYDLQPFYVRKSDAEIAWDNRRVAG
jgi:tRNA threonylcarbamoyladenosine biosynthesis protein TsaB